MSEIDKKQNTSSLRTVQHIDYHAAEGDELDGAAKLRRVAFARLRELADRSFRRLKQAVCLPSDANDACHMAAAAAEIRRS